MMVTTRRTLVGGAALLAAGTVAAVALLRKPPPEIHTLVPQQAEPALLGMSALAAITPPAAPPAFSFQDASGATHTLADFSGKGVVLNFWATWCVPCVAELPSLAALAGKLSGVVVLPVSTDRGGAETVTRFYASHAIAGLGVWLDPKGAASDALHLRGLPTTLLIDRQGRERGRLEGGADWDTDAAVAEVRRLLG
jgi:thiol-disulfide isomerase/thioredoxin